MTIEIERMGTRSLYFAGAGSKYSPSGRVITNQCISRVCSAFLFPSFLSISNSSSFPFHCIFGFLGNFCVTFPHTTPALYKPKPLSPKFLIRLHHFLLFNSNLTHLCSVQIFYVVFVFINMECRTLEITVISAQDIKDVNLFSKMDVYAVVMIAGDESSKQKTPIHKHGGTSPKWNHHMKFPINEELARQNRPTLHFLLKSERSFGDKDIGEVYVPIQELNGNGYGKSGREVSFGVRKPSGRDKGVLTFSYKFGQKFVVETIKEPVMMAYPAAGKVGTCLAYAAPAPPPEGYYAPPPPPPPAHAAGYPPPPVAGCGYPPAAPGYGYPPSQAAYGYGYVPPPVQKPHKKKKNKLGFGSGLLGGLLIGDMLSDVGDACAYDAGYCDGIDDAGDFDF